MKITAQNIENFIKAPPQNLLVALFYGQDQGLINENALALAQQLVPDLNDPFSVNTLSGEQITADPALLFDSASTLPPMGGKRLIRISNITDTATKHIQTLLTNPPTDCVIVMTSQSVNTRAKLVKLLDTNPQAASIGCYADTTQQLTKLANEIFSQHHITADPRRPKLDHRKPRRRPPHQPFGTRKTSNHGRNKRTHRPKHSHDRPRRQHPNRHNTNHHSSSQRQHSTK